MIHTFHQFISQTYNFPQRHFDLSPDAERLFFHGLDIQALIEEFGSPLKISYLPHIRTQIRRAQGFFGQAMQKFGYDKPYVYTYCTKSSHFAHVLEQVLAENVHLEISSAFDTEIILNLYAQGKLGKDKTILCNGHKTPAYLAGIHKLLKAGFEQIIPILDSTHELKAYEKMPFEQIQIGLRMATEEDSDFDLYTSRFGIRMSEILGFYKEKIQPNPKFRLKMLHFFVYSGIRNTAFYWNELQKYAQMYADLKKICPALTMLNMGGGLPVQNGLNFDYCYQEMCDGIIETIQTTCQADGVDTPILFSEFGTFTVAESGAMFFKIIETKRQNDRESWYIIDNSLINSLPDMWADKQKFILLPINRWNTAYQKVILGGLTCDNDDYCNLIAENDTLQLPCVERTDEKPLYVGFFHTGAYQESLSGFGGLSHCLIPAAKHLLIDKDEAGELQYKLFATEQSAEAVLNLLGYKAR